MKQLLFNTLILFIVMCLGGVILSDHLPKNNNKEINTNIITVKELIIPTDPKKDLYDVMEYYNIKFPHLVYAQALLETGHFTSNNYKNNNNLFGLYDSKNKRYYKFNHWAESVKAYKDMIQYKYKEGDYYEFLEEIGYAEDEKYIDKLKNIKIND